MPDYPDEEDWCSSDKYCIENEGEEYRCAIVKASGGGRHEASICIEKILCGQVMRLEGFTYNYNCFDPDGDHGGFQN